MNRVMNSFPQSVLKKSLILTIPTYYWYRKQVKHKYKANTEITPKITALRRAVMNGNKTIDEISKEYEKYLVKTMNLASITTDNEQRASLGTGIIVGDQGLVFTNYHIVRESASISVSMFKRDSSGDVFNEDVWHKAHVVYTNPGADIALVRVRSGKLIASTVMFNDGKVHAGQRVLSIGNPEIDYSLCDGVICCDQREAQTISDGTYEYYMNYIDPKLHFIDHSCPITHGFSGGPLIDSNGHIVGVNWGGLLTYESCFAASYKVIDDVIKSQRLYRKLTIESKYLFVKQNSLGIAVRMFDESMKAMVNVLENIDIGGVVVIQSLNSYNNQNGFMNLDIIREINGNAINSVEKLQNYVKNCTQNEKLVINVIRFNESKQLNISIKPINYSHI